MHSNNLKNCRAPLWVDYAKKYSNKVDIHIAGIQKFLCA